MIDKFKDSTPPTMKDIARKSGYDTSTVSRALRNDPRLAEATKQKIRTVADACGYRPNPLVAALMSHRRRRAQSHSTVVAFVTAFPSRDQWREKRYIQLMFEGASRQAELLGYKIEEFWLKEPGMSPQRMSDIFETRGISGIILAPLYASTIQVHLDWNRFSAVALSLGLHEPKLHHVSHNMLHGMKMAMGECRSLGYKRPGLAMCRRVDLKVEYNWRAAYLTEQFLWPESNRIPPLISDELTPDRFNRWFEKHRPDVLIGLQGDGAYQRLLDLDLSVPADVGFISLDCPGPDDPLSGIYQYSDRVGATAVDFLVGMLHRNEKGLPRHPQTLFIDGEWNPGATVCLQV